MFSVRLTNDGPATPVISAIKVRYYFRDDSTNRDATPMVLDAKWKIASPSSTIDLRMGTGCAIVTTFATAPQNSFFDVNCQMPSPLLVQDTITMSLANGPATQVASNDYSYADTAGAFAPNDHILLLLNGAVVAGTAALIRGDDQRCAARLRRRRRPVSRPATGTRPAPISPAEPRTKHPASSPATEARHGAPPDGGGAVRAWLSRVSQRPVSARPAPAGRRNRLAAPGARRAQIDRVRPDAAAPDSAIAARRG